MVRRKRLPALLVDGEEEFERNMGGAGDGVRHLPESASFKRSQAGYGHIERAIPNGIVELLNGKHRRLAATPSEDLSVCRTGHTDPLTLQPQWVRDIPPFGEKHGIAERLPPENTGSGLGED